MLNVKRNVYQLFLNRGSSIIIVSFLQVVEISKGSKVKYELDKKTGMIKVIMRKIQWSEPLLVTIGC